jgi:hypothetical protein
MVLPRELANKTQMVCGSGGQCRRIEQASNVDDRWHLGPDGGGWVSQVLKTARFPNDASKAPF